MKKEFCIKFNNSKDKIKKFKRFVKEHDCPEITVDLSALNIFDAAEFAVLSSVYHSRKYPAGRLKYRTASDDIKNLLSGLCISNFELV